MDNDYRTLHERVAVLETKMDDLQEIKDKLDQLLHIKSKGVGALWFISIIISLGISGLISTAGNWFTRVHL